LKRFLDIIVASASLAVLAVPLMLVAAAIWFTIGRPVLFRQLRPGLHERPFPLLKFRTMTDSRDDQGNLLPDAARITRLGRWLRSTSIDELPELWNVLVGDMSLVGPRPLLMEYLPLYTSEQARRHGIRPGLTGWAQVNGRNALSWEEKFKLDVWYVDNQSCGLDLKILWLTCLKVLKREGISASGEATMPRFTGTELPSSGREL
jgi:lipopolysaccharide/colanic/teichoic acid biosynthesis glycosyltransferase